MTPFERIVAGIAAQPEDTRQRRRLAATYQLVERYEQLLALRETPPDLFERITDPTTRIALGSYEQAKQAYEAEQREGASHGDN